MKTITHAVTVTVGCDWPKCHNTASTTFDYEPEYSEYLMFFVNRLWWVKHGNWYCPAHADEARLKHGYGPVNQGKR